MVVWRSVSVGIRDLDIHCGSGLQALAKLKFKSRRTYPFGAIDVFSLLLKEKISIFVKSNEMTTIQINEKTKIGKNVLEMLKVLAQAENENSIKFLDDTDYLLSTKANKDALMHGTKQVAKGEMGKTIKISDLWK